MQLAALWLALVPAALAQNAPGVSVADRTAIREVIDAQLEAFAQDDAETAFGFASPGIRASFETAERFMGMVARAYPAIYRPSLILYQDLTVTPGGAVQQLAVRGDDGQAWHARYLMERHGEHWRIGGVQLVALAHDAL